MIVSIASDHGGFDQKRELVAYLQKRGYEVADRGALSDARCDYPDYAAVVAADVVDGAADFGVLVCGTGIGMSIAANKIDGVRAANVTSEEFAQLARGHNNANIVTLSGRFVPLEVNERILDVFLSADFEGGRHAERVAKIMALEQE